VISCALPPVDMRYARVVAVDNQGLDIVSFDGRHPVASAVIAAVPGVVTRHTWPQTADYRHAVQIDVSEAAGRPLWVVYSGLEFGSRVPAGSRVRPGDVIGRTEMPTRTSFLRVRDRTAGCNPTVPYLHVEVWTRMPPPFVQRLGTSGPYHVPEGNVLDPRTFWPSVGLTFVGQRGSERLVVRRGSPADCGSV
jgi:hypothetical protein